jgi:hypothetical protein
MNTVKTSLLAVAVLCVTVMSVMAASRPGGGHGGSGLHGRYDGGYGGGCLDPARGWHWCPNDTAHPRIDN